MLRMTVVSSQKKANSPAVPSAGAWKLACKLRHSSGTVCFPVMHCGLSYQSVLMTGAFIQLQPWFLHLHTLLLEVDVHELLQKGKRLF